MYKSKEAKELLKKEYGWKSLNLFGIKYHLVGSWLLEISLELKGGQPLWFWA